MVPFSFAHEKMAFAGDRALFWPRENALLVADLHLEKGSFFARRGQMLPPYDSRETLGRLADLVRRTGARRVFCLGDNFHDEAGADRLEEHAAGMLAALVRAVDWVWITGNHDAKLAQIAGGGIEAEVEIAGLVLRHRAGCGEKRPELSGHFHPRLTVEARGRRIARPCAVVSESRLVLPAFGALTGGMSAGDPALLGALRPARAIDALVPAGDQLARYPLWREGGAGAKSVAVNPE